MFIRGFIRALDGRLREKFNFLQVIIGPRQVGKTTGVKSLLSKWPGPSLYCTADSPVPPRPEWIAENWKKARLLGANTLLVIDEVQKVEGWSEVVKLLFDEDRGSENLRVVILGSASLALKVGLEESLLGRFELIRVHHWDAYESKEAFGWDLNTYLKYGGYPAAANLINDEQRLRQFMRDAVVEPIIAKDILALRQISNMSLFRQSFEIALSYPAREISYQKLLGQLQDKGNIATIKSYLSILEQVFVIKILEKYSTKVVKTKSSSPKIVPLAPALVHAFSNPQRIESDLAWRGQVFEAAVIAKILTAPGEVYYWRQGKHEVDAVWRYDDMVLGIEIKSTRGHGDSISGLAKFRENFPHAKTILLDEHLATELLMSREPRSLLEQYYEVS